MNSLILLRGLPGSGKSTLAKVLSENGKYPVYSVDDYFTDEKGNYSFIFSENHLAYKQCENLTRESMRNGISKIILDNTFTLEWEMLPYQKMAEEFGYQCFYLVVENRHNGKNPHGIDDEQLGKMASKFKVNL